MKKLINRLARVLPFTLLICVLFAIACDYNQANIIATCLMPVVIVLNIVLFVILCVCYLIHILWMIRDHVYKNKVKKELLKCVVTCIVLLLVIDGKTLIQNGMTYQALCTDIVIFAFITLFIEISQYVYQMKME